MCETTTAVLVRIPADLSHTGEARLAMKPIDSCIADLVQALQEKGVWTRSSCCGHGKSDGCIDLEDGRRLVVKERPGVGSGLVSDAGILRFKKASDQ